MLKKQKGFTLIELLAGVALSLILFSTIVSLTVTLAKSEANRIKTQKTETELIKAAQLMMNDIKRAGYKNSAFTDVDTGNNNNEFITLHNTTAFPDCISLAYDENHDDAFIKSNQNYTEKFAYRPLDSDIQMLTSLSQGSNPAATACNDNDNQIRWTALLSPPLFTATGLDITNRSVVINPLSETGTSIEKRAFNIEIQGSPSIKISVKNRNDKFND